jgi:6-phosphogluconolactonase
MRRPAAASLLSAIFSGTQFTTTGALTPISGSPFAVRFGASSVAVDPTGKFAYVTSIDDNVSGYVSGYAIDPNTGALTAISGSPFAAGVAPISVAVDPTGRFAYVANGNSNNVSAYTIDPTTGALTVTSGSPFATLGNPDSVTVDPTGRFAYVAMAGFPGLFGYTIDPTTGALTAISGSPFEPGLAVSVAVDPTGKFAYTANHNYNNVSAFTINPTTGALTAISGSPFAAGSGPRSVVVARPQ